MVVVVRPSSSSSWSGGLVLVLEWRMDSRRLGVDPAGVIVGLTCTAVLLMQTPLLDGVCCCLLPEGLAVLVGEIPACSV